MTMTMLMTMIVVLMMLIMLMTITGLAMVAIENVAALSLLVSPDNLYMIP